jgi:alkanesulfonate monooxygenase SsuD/methylene tetrahydromethanopterin reductase-like flavin-dependent oxidoreductase (luciferase family)
LRRLWTERSISYEGHFDRVTGAGIWPLPVQRPIPIWLGGSSVPAYRRAGRLADGWFPQISPGPRLDDAISVVQGAAAEAGRDPDRLGMEGRVAFDGRNTDELAATVQQWRDAGATHLCINTMGSGLPGADAHLGALTAAAEALALKETSS